MSMPDPRHSAASVPLTTPPAPQWGGEAPSVIDPGLIAKLGNAFLNASPGQTVDPQALANFAITQERPPAPPTSVPGAIGAAAAAPGTSVPGALATAPFAAGQPGYPTQFGGAPPTVIDTTGRHIPAAGLATSATGIPAGAAGTPLLAAGLPGPSPEKGQETVHGFPGEAELRALPHSLGQATSLVPTTLPSGFSPAGFSHSSIPGPEALYFLNDTGTAAAQPSVPAAVPPAPAFEQSPAFRPNYPSEADLRPQAPGSVSAFPLTPSPAGFSHGAKPATPAIPGETLYFLNEGQAASAPVTAPEAPVPTPESTAVTPTLEPALAPDLISGTRAFDAYAIKRDFPNLQQQVHGKPLIWLDNAATTQKPQAVIDRLALFYETENSNIHRAAHALAARSTDAYEAAREKVRRFLGAGSANEIVFTRGATEAINLVAQAWGCCNVHRGDEIVITWLEHHANIVPWQMLCADVGAVLRVAPVDDSGQVILEEYTKLLSPKTRLVSLPQVSNALGTVTPAQEMVAIAHRHGACVLVDGAQAVSHMPVNVQALDCDFYVFSGHKVFGPTGIGVLYGKPDVLAAMPPWQGGGNMIADVTFEKTVYQAPPLRFEAGTGNIADAVGLGAAIDYLDRIGMANIASYEHELLDYATLGLNGVPGLTIIGTAKEKAGVISFVLDGCRSEDVGAALDREGIAVRAGHHCAQPILRRFGLETTVRPSLALYNTNEDIDALVAALHKIQTQKSYRGH
ncbi:MAG TPA: family 2A encapsulin nanocompartment cargo protein cysteine desulfurase [Methylocella sp.]